MQCYLVLTRVLLMDDNLIVCRIVIENKQTKKCPNKTIKIIYICESNITVYIQFISPMSFYVMKMRILYNINFWSISKSLWKHIVL